MKLMDIETNVIDQVNVKHGTKIALAIYKIAS
jgi:hypothetical protein